MSNPKFYTMLGFASRARALVSGETGCLSAITRGKAHLVVLATDASANTRDRFAQRCRSRSVKLVFAGTKLELGNAIGKNSRSCLAILDVQFSKTLLESLGERVTM